MTVSTNPKNISFNGSLKVKFQLRGEPAGPIDGHGELHRAGDCDSRPATGDVSCKCKEGNHKNAECTQSIETEQKPTIEH